MYTNIAQLHRHTQPIHTNNVKSSSESSNRVQNNHILSFYERRHTDSMYDIRCKLEKLLLQWTQRTAPCIHQKSSRIGLDFTQCLCGFLSFLYFFFFLLTFSPSRGLLFFHRSGIVPSTASELLPLFSRTTSTTMLKAIDIRVRIDFALKLKVDYYVISKSMKHG